MDPIRNHELGHTKMKKTRHSSQISHDIIHDILIRLPVKSILRFRAVSTQWRALISGPHFKKSQAIRAIKGYNVNHFHMFRDLSFGYPSKACFHSNAEHSGRVTVTSIQGGSIGVGALDLVYPFNQPPNKNVFLGSCNGLVLIAGLSDKTFLWNPSTKESKTFPMSLVRKLGIITPLRGSLRYWCKFFNSGLGYNPSLDEYKAVISFGNLTFVFSSKTGKWRPVEGQSQDHFHTLNYVGITVNGAPHWIESNVWGDVRHGIKCFDVVDEKWKKVLTPTAWWDDDSMVSMSAFEGCLCVVQYRIALGGEVNVWQMKEYGNGKSWTKLFVFERLILETFKPMGFFNTGHVLVFWNNNNKLVAFNLKNEEKHHEYNVAATYVETLVSP